MGSGGVGPGWVAYAVVLKGTSVWLGDGVGLTKLWLAVLESSSGKGMYTPRATQLAKMVRRMRMSKGLR